jgi:hypothetical protein
MWQPLGRHQVKLDGDVLHSRWFGAASLAELDQFLALAAELLDRHPLGFIVVDNTHAASGRPEVRRRIFEWSRSHTIAGGVAVYGANGAARVIGMLVVHAIRIIKGSDSNQRIVFVRDEAEALAWLSRRRTALASRPR